MKSLKTPTLRTCFRLLTLTAILTCSVLSAIAEDSPFETLFNGQDLTGWVKQGPAGFEVKDQVLVCNGSGNYPSWLRTEEIYENFVLRLEYRNLHGAEGGVFFSAPLHGRIAHVGFDIRIANNTGQPRDFSPGAIFEAIPPTIEAALHYSDPEWNRLEITMNWPSLKVVLNDQTVQDLDIREHESLRYRPRFGYIGLQDRGKLILFRNLEIKRLPSVDREKWTTLFNGKDLDGWSISEKCSAQWTVEEGELLGIEGHGYLITDREFHNLAFETYIQSSPLANGGIFFRWKKSGGRGFEIQIEDIPDSRDPTGSIYGRVRASCQPFQPGEWALMQVFLEDRFCLVRINGTTVAQTDDLPVDRSGQIALQMHTGNGWIRFKQLRAKPLDTVTPESDVEAN